MGRRPGRFKLEFIKSAQARRTTFEKRKKGLKKKIEELCILCDVKACMIVCGLKQGEVSPTKPEVWPANVDEFNEVMNHYQQIDIDDRNKRAWDVPKFYEQEMKKIREKVLKLRRTNDEAQSAMWDEGMNGISEEEVKQQLSLLESKHERIQLAIEERKSKQISPGRGAEMVEYAPGVMNQNPLCYMPNNSMYNDCIKAEPVSYMDLLNYRMMSSSGLPDPPMIFCGVSDPSAIYGDAPMRPLNEYSYDGNNTGPFSQLGFRTLQEMEVYGRNMPMNPMLSMNSFHYGNNLGTMSNGGLKPSEDNVFRNQEAWMLPPPLMQSIPPMQAIPPNLPYFIPGSSNQMNFNHLPDSQRST